jgi:peptidyl-prolyl cis-trans isomerase A (cyclophilin A)
MLQRVGGGWVARLLGVASGRAVRAASSGVMQQMEQLEPRLVLSDTPLPTLGDLESATNTVVRIETNFGDIDVELFDTDAPITVANFLEYVNSGRFDGTFFHRSVTSPNPFVLQGGAFVFDDVSGVSARRTDATIIREDTGRSNVARTLAMARTNVIDSATNQFFINYVDNLFLDPTGPDDGYAVFGRVIRGWDIVTTIQGLNVFDSNDSLGNNPNVGAIFDEVPLGPTYQQNDPVREEDLVVLTNAEVIKLRGSTAFLNFRSVFPDGFRSDSSTETVELFNPNSGPASYQIIIRYETGDREEVAQSGTLPAGAKVSIELWRPGASNPLVTRAGVPYAVIVESSTTATSALPVAATSNRIDFNATEGEGFFNVRGSTDAQLSTWDFPRFERNALSREFLTWANLEDRDVSITMTFFLPDGTTTTRTAALEGFRRGGVDLATLSLPNGLLGVRVTSTGPIVAGLSDWDLVAAGIPTANAYTPGFGVIGVSGGGSASGALAEVFGSNTSSDTISILNPGTTAAAVTLRFWRTTRTTGGDPIQRFELIPAQSRFDFTIDFGLLGISSGERVAVTYSAGSTPIAAQYTSFLTANRNQAGTIGDGVATTFTTRLGNQTFFADGRMDPARAQSTQLETISIYSPFSNAATTQSYTIRYHFSDGTTIDAFTGSLTANAVLRFTSGDSAQVRSKVSSGAQFQNYGISVTAVTGGSSPVRSSPVVQFSRVDTSINGRSLTTIGTQSDFGRSVGDSSFGLGV